MLGIERCLSFGGSRVDTTIAEEILRVVEPMAIEAALEAERMILGNEAERRRMAELDLQQARYDASLAARRYAACDPDNRLIAAQLETSWEAALERVQACETRLDAMRSAEPPADAPTLYGLAEDLTTAWNAPGVTMRARQRLVWTLITDIIAEVDEELRDIVLTIHWRGGRHSRLRVRKPKTGEHGCRTPEEALEVIQSMAGRWADEHIAASLNRMGLRTGQSKSWNAKRVGSIRRVHGIDAYLSADKDSEWCTMSEAAMELGVTNHVIRRLIQEQELPARQVVPGAPYQIRAADLSTERVVAALSRQKRPRRLHSHKQISIFSTS